MIQGVRRKTLVQILSKVSMKPNGVKENRKTLEMVRIHKQYFYIVGSYPCRPMTICQFEVSQKLGVVYKSGFLYQEFRVCVRSRKISTGYFISVR